MYNNKGDENMKNIKNIFVDMDNVLYLFSQRGQENVALREMWKKGYFENLPLIDEFVQQELQKLNDEYNIFILSKCINEQCQKEKNIALDRDFSFIPSHRRILILLNESKTEHIEKVAKIDESVLIDDFKGNLQEFSEKGGTVIKKRYSNKNGYRHILKEWNNIIDILEEIEQWK